jgi:hypothetical protein
MIIPFTHTKMYPMRGIIATMLTIIYMMVVLSPLTSLAMNSKTLIHALTGECTGDCDTCGCSIERRDSHTCCCAMKKKQQAHIHDDVDVDGPECCKKERTENKKTVIACGCPCGGGKQASLTASGTSEVLPFHFTELFNLPHTDTTFSDPAHRLASRHNKPPEPPPKSV